jgi:hypothetical protein
MRIRLDDGSRPDAYFASKSPEKCAVSLQHRALPDAKAKERMRAFWTHRVEALRAMLETP